MIIFNAELIIIITIISHLLVFLKHCFSLLHLLLNLCINTLSVLLLSIHSFAHCVATALNSFFSECAAVRAVVLLPGFFVIPLKINYCLYLLLSCIVSKSFKL